MGQKKIGTPSSSLEKINVVVMGKDDVGKSGQNDYHEQVVIAQCIMVLRQNRAEPEFAFTPFLTIQFLKNRSFKVCSWILSVHQFVGQSL